MAGIDPYAPCPCGSGQKFKWCCHKVESFADRAQRLFEGGQHDAALKVLDEGLAKQPCNPWLLTRKAIIELRSGRVAEGRAALEQVLARQPKHVGALMLMTRLALETEGPAQGVRRFQTLLTSVDEPTRETLGPLARVLGQSLTSTGEFPAALRHLELALTLGDDDSEADSAILSIEKSPSVSPWLKNPYELAPAPEGTPDDARGRFEQALKDAEGGLWSIAAPAFEGLAGDDALGRAALRNASLCRLWLIEEAAAEGLLRRYIRPLGETDEAVDLEALRQLIAPTDPEQDVERVQLSWPIRDRERLLANLRALGDVQEDGTVPLDPSDEESAEVPMFALLDRPALAVEPGVKPRADQIPRVVGRVVVAQDTVLLETYDDGRLDRLSDRFTSLAGQAIPPAHPKTRVLGKIDRPTLALAWDWMIPEGLPREAVERLDREERSRVLREVWPTTPMPALGGKSPEQAKSSPEHRVALRAAVMLLDAGRSDPSAAAELDELRGRLGLPPEPEVAVGPDGAFDAEEVHIGRLHLVPAESLDDAPLTGLYFQARRFMLPRALERAARAVISRPALLESDRIPAYLVFTDLAGLAVARGQFAEGLELVARGRQADTPARRAENGPAWDFFELRIKTRFQTPEEWVPELAILLERHTENDAARQLIMINLMEMGLIQTYPHPDRPGDILLDTRPLQMVMSRYGPKVTTASGRLGVSATKPEIWTPGGPSGGGSGGIWTPGSGSGPAPGGPPGDKPKLIITGH